MPRQRTCVSTPLHVLVHDAGIHSLVLSPHVLPTSPHSKKPGFPEGLFNAQGVPNASAGPEGGGRAGRKASPLSRPWGLGRATYHTGVLLGFDHVR